MLEARLPFRVQSADGEAGVRVIGSDHVCGLLDCLVQVAYLALGNILPRHDADTGSRVLQRSGDFLAFDDLQLEARAGSWGCLLRRRCAFAQLRFFYVALGGRLFDHEPWQFKTSGETT